MFTEQLTQELSLADDLIPANTVNSATPVYSTGLDMSKFKRVMYEIQIGAITGAGTVDAKLQSCAASNFGSGVHNITGSNITQVTNANPNTRVTIEVRADEVEQQNHGDRYVRLAVTIGANSVVFGATGWGASGIHEPANANDLPSNTVIQRVVV